MMSSEKPMPLAIVKKSYMYLLANFIALAPMVLQTSVVLLGLYFILTHSTMLGLFYGSEISSFVGVVHYLANGYFLGAIFTAPISIIVFRNIILDEEIQGNIGKLFSKKTFVYVLAFLLCSIPFAIAMSTISIYLGAMLFGLGYGETIASMFTHFILPPLLIAPITVLVTLHIILILPAIAAGKKWKFLGAIKQNRHVLLRFFLIYLLSLLLIGGLVVGWSLMSFGNDNTSWWSLLIVPLCIYGSIPVTAALAFFYKHVSSEA